MDVDRQLGELARKSPNFGYLLSYLPDLVVLGAGAEAYVYSDPNASLVKARIFGELLTKALAASMGLRLTGRTDQDNRIRTLVSEGVLSRDMAVAFHLLRTEGNKAVHQNVGRSFEALRAVHACYRIGRWYYRMQTGDRTPHAFIPPPEPTGEALSGRTASADPANPANQPTSQAAPQAVTHAAAQAASTEIAELRAELARQRDRLEEVALRLDGSTTRLEAEKRARREVEAALAQVRADAGGLRRLVETISARQADAQVDARADAVEPTAAGSADYLVDGRQLGGLRPVERPDRLGADAPPEGRSPARAGGTGALPGGVATQLGGPVPRRVSAAEREAFIAHARAAAVEPRTEIQVRAEVDRMLVAAGWVVQDVGRLNLGAGVGVAVREGRTASGPADYLLYVDRKLVGVVEAKREGTILLTTERQSTRYATTLTAAQRLAAWRPELPFRYETTATQTRFTNALDPKPRSRAVFSFHQPGTLSRWMREADSDPERPSLRARLAALPSAFPLDVSPLRPPQVDAVLGLEASLADDRPRALIQMATGAGKTYTAVTAAFRLLEYAKAHRVLFLVDRNTLGRQAKDEFDNFVTPGDGRKFTELFNVDPLSRAGLLGSTNVVVSTVQRMYAMLRGEEEPAPDVGDHPLADDEPDDPVELVYNPGISPETFDLIIVDECHRSIYGRWRAVLEYFDAYLVGLTATPVKQTFGFFRQNLVSEYTYQQAVADDVNVDFDVYRIRTELTGGGATIEAGTTVPIRDRRTRAQRLESLDDDVTWTPAQLGRSVISLPQLHLILRTFRDKLFTEIFPGRAVVPKTLVFTRDDNHADEVVQAIREVFGVGNDFAAKITYREPDAEKLLRAFRNSPELRIAVTVDMIATGTDVKPLECLLFLRNPKSWSLFEQMKGRGARTIDVDDLREVTPGATKDRFVIIDAVGALDVDRGDAAPLAMHPERQVSLEQLLRRTADGTISPEETSTLASRLARLNHQLSPAERDELARLADGRPLTDVVRALTRVADADTYTAAAASGPGGMRTLVDEAVRPLAGNPELRKRLLEIRRQHDIITDDVNPDTLLAAEGVPPAEIAQRTVTSWQAYVRQHREEIELIQAAYEKGTGERSAYALLTELAARIERPPHQWTPDRLWDAYERLEISAARPGVRYSTVDLLGLIRFELGVDEQPTPHRAMVAERFTNWLARQRQAGVEFGPEQLWWLERIRDVVATSAGITLDDLDEPPFTNHGGINAFGDIFADDALDVFTDLSRSLTSPASPAAPDSPTPRTA